MVKAFVAFLVLQIIIMIGIDYFRARSKQENLTSLVLLGYSGAISIVVITILYIIVELF